MLTLVLNEDGNELTLKLTQDLISIGRSRENIIIVKNKKASRAHAKIERIGGTYQITDLGSGNGTKVNGSKIDFHTLAAGDEIKIGDATLLLKSIDDEITDDSEEQSADQTDLSEHPTEHDIEAPADDLTFKDEQPETEIVTRPGPKAKPQPAKPAPKPAMLGKPQAQGAARPAAPPRAPGPSTPAPKGPAAPGGKPRISLNERFRKKT